MDVKELLQAQRAHFVLVKQIDQQYHIQELLYSDYQRFRTKYRYNRFRRVTKKKALRDVMNLLCDFSREDELKLFDELEPLYIKYNDMLKEKIKEKKFVC